MTSCRQIGVSYMKHNHTQCEDLLQGEENKPVVYAGSRRAQCYVLVIFESARAVFANSFGLLPKPDGK